MNDLTRSSLVVLCLCMGTACENGSQPSGIALSPDAPRDQPVAAKGTSEIEELRAALAPYVEKARQTYPEAKRRYLAGLPQGHVFFTVTRIRDGDSMMEEQVFIAVSGIRDGKISGNIASDLLGVRSYKRGDMYTFPETELIDWLVSRPDGSEEGNVVGKFLDDWQKSKAVK